MSDQGLKLEEVEVEIAPDGTVKLWVKGVDGPRCIELTAELEALLGVVLDRELSPEYYNPVALDNQQHLGAGSG